MSMGNKHRTIRIHWLRQASKSLHILKQLEYLIYPCSLLLFKLLMQVGYTYTHTYLLKISIFVQIQILMEVNMDGEYDKHPEQLVGCR